MSAQNVEIVRTLFDRWGTREMNRSFELLHEDVVIELADPLPGFAARYRGHAAVRGFWREWLSAWDSVAIAEYELHEAGEIVHARWEQEMRGKGGEVAIRLQQRAEFRLSAGRVTRIRYFNLAARPEGER